MDEIEILKKENKKLKEDNIKLRKEMSIIPYGLKELGVKDEQLFWKHMEEDNRQAEWQKARLIHGFDERETWGFDFVCSCYIYSRLKFMKDKTDVYIGEDTVYKLDAILYAFAQTILHDSYDSDIDKFVISKRYNTLTDDEKRAEYNRILRKIRKGFYYFFKNFDGFWW